MVKVVKESSIIDSVYVDMFVYLRKEFLEEGVMLLGISGMSGVEILRLIIGFRDGQSLLSPVDGGVYDMEPGESEDNVFLAAAHDVEEMFLGNPFNVCVEGAM